MLDTFDQAQYRTVEMASGYGQFLVTKMPFTTKFPCPPVPGQPPWNSPENISSGTGGIILLLLELYRQFREDVYLRAADETIASLLAFCRMHPTGNYSLYTGRAGVFYVLICRYLIDNDKTVLTANLDLIRPANEEYLHSQHTPNELYDGRAGTLLMLLHLFRIVRAPFLAEYIGQFIDKILGKAKLSHRGLYWHREDEFNLGPVCGLAYGAAGIHYVLSQLDRFAPHPTFTCLLAETMKFIRSCWAEDLQNWGNYRKLLLDKETEAQYSEAYGRSDVQFLEPANDYGWADGTVGLLVAGMQGQFGASGNGCLSEHMTGTTLYNGLAGLGLFYLTTGRHTREWQQLSTRLTDYLAGEPEFRLEGGLLHGQPGVLYFLTMALRGAVRCENLLAPFLYADQQEPLMELPVPSVRQTRKILLTGAYPRTFRLWEAIDTPAATDHLERPGATAGGELSLFVSRLEERLLPASALQGKERLKDVFQLENEKLTYLRMEKRSPLQLFLDKDLHHDRVRGWLNRPDEWLLQQTLRLSTASKVVTTNWNWSLPDAPLQHSEYVLYVTPKGDVAEIYLTPDNLLLLHCFDQPCEAGQALARIRKHIASIPEKELDRLIRTFTNFPTTGYFLHVMEKGVLFTIRQWLNANILICSS
jgi:hypothetical protein